MSYKQMLIGGKWYNVTYNDDLADAWDELDELDELPPWCMVDCETTGLHIKKDTPFLAAFGWTGRIFVFPTNFANVAKIHHIANRVGMLYNHNINFDLHMLANIVGDNEYAYRFVNIGDTMGLCRLIFEAISARDGGDNLKLKDIGKKYVDNTVDKYQKAVKNAIAEIEKADRKELIQRLKPFGWGIQRFEKAMDKGHEEIPVEVSDTFYEWRREHPQRGYKDVPMDIMVPYVAVDIMLVDRIVEKALPVIEHRRQFHIMNQEFALLPVTWDMERQGIPVDMEYMQASADRLDEYIERMTSKMHKLANREFTVGQHAVIKDIYELRTGERPESTDKKYLKYMKDGGDELAGIISTLRRLEKWKSTYIDRVMEIARFDGKFYTSMGQFNPVSGRFSGDAQQFPKDGIFDEDPESPTYKQEVFTPRKAFFMRGFYLDFSQVELRVQGHYTLYYGGDTNLCRAYMPFECHHYLTGEEYDFSTVEGRSRWNEMREGADTANIHWEDLLKAGWSAWINPDTEEPWIPTDVHGATTEKALRAMGIVLEELPKEGMGSFKWWRSKGKQFNFMRNYGGGDHMAADTLDIALEAAKAMNRGYSDSFPLVIDYQNGVIRTMRKQGYAENMSGRRYYLSESNKFYKVANYLIQGSCADDLKKKMIKINRFIRDNNLKLRMVLCVHDELQFSCPDPAEDWAIWEIKAIMENAPEFLVPIVAEVEFSDTNWYNKKKVLGVA
jgi:DNA polymerase-1